MFQINEYFAPLIKMMSEAIERKTNILLKEYGVTSGQIHILVVLSTMENNECTLKKLEKIFSFSQAAIAATASRLETKGFVEGYVKEDDKRVKYVRLTTKGEQVVEVAQNKLLNMQKELFSDFSEEEQKQFMSYLQKMHKKLV